MQAFYEIKNVIWVSDSSSLEECSILLASFDFCLGVKDADNNILGYVLKPDSDRVLKFDIKDKCIRLITSCTSKIVAFDDLSTQKHLNKILGSKVKEVVWLDDGNDSIDKLAILSKKNKLEDIYLIEEFKQVVENPVQNLFKKCSKVADANNIPIFLIGGIVRDLIIGRKSFDIDITVQGNAIDFAHLLMVQYPDTCIINSLHEDFETAKVTFLIDDNEIKVDFASTRKEAYDYPAALPRIIEIGCELYDDVIRRDFTINSMAMSLNEETFCKLIDYLGGYQDLNAKVIRVLHPVSYVDDPTRVIRALKFGMRFDCESDKSTNFLEKSCLDSGLFDGLCGKRIKSELKQTFNLNRASVFTNFVERRLYYLIEKNIIIDEVLNNLGEEAEICINDHLNYLEKIDNIWLIYLSLLIIDLDKARIADIANRLYLSVKESKIILQSCELWHKLQDLRGFESNFEIYEFLGGYCNEALVVNLIKFKGSNVVGCIELFLTELKNAKISVNGNDLIRLGLKPGPEFSRILRGILKAKINNKLKTKEDELDYINILINGEK